MYNIKYDSKSLNNFGRVKEVKKSILPKRKISTIDIESLNGEILNSSKYEALDIEITMVVTGSNKEEFRENILNIINIFNVSETKPLIIDDEKFCYCITNDGIEKEPFSNVGCFVVINLIALDPYFYSMENKVFDSENNKLNVVNEGGEKVLPYMSIGFSKDTHFLQLEHQENGKRILIGDYPKLSLVSKGESTEIVRDTCEDTSGWVIAQAPIDSDRTVGGTLAMNEKGSGICIGSVPSGSTTWKGVCARKNFTKSLDEFHLRCCMHHNSTGKNGDPTYPTFTDSSEHVTEEVETYYVVTSNSLNYRTGPGTSYKKLGTLSKGFMIDNNFTVENGWVKFLWGKKHGDTYCYCSTKYLTKKTKTTKVTTTQKNFIVTAGSDGSYAVLRSEPKRDSKYVTSFKNGTVVRCITTTHVDPNNSDRKYYKLAKKVNGYMGYIDTSLITEASNVSFSYDESEDYLYADDKTGIVELYGFDANGAKLFCLGMYDDNEWYEYTYPKCVIGTREVLKDATKVPKPNQLTVSNGSGDNVSVGVTNYMSGKFGDWNEFYGDWNISRKKVDGNYVWEVSVSKIKDGVVTKTQKSTNIKYSDLPTGELAYVALYMGTTGTLSNASAVDFTHLVINEINPTTEEEENITYFKQGDILDIDFESGRAYLNHDDRTDLIAADSELFEIETGVNNIKVVSDDNDVSVSAVIKEKWLGSD